MAAPIFTSGFSGEGLPSEIGTRMIWHEGPNLDAKTFALGLCWAASIRPVRGSIYRG